MSAGTHTYWRMTINNYDETDLALVQQGYPEHIRQLVYTLEEGEEGTPHIQAYMRMKRDCRLSHMKKLFPRGNFGYIDSNEYQLNSQRYAQKLDTTARSPATITNWDPLLTIEGTIKKVILGMIEDYGNGDYDFDDERRWVEKAFVEEDYKYAKVFVSATYKQMWRDYGHEMYKCIFMEKENADAERHKRWRAEVEARATLPTHTHTHTDEIFSRAGGIKDADENKRKDIEELGEQEDSEEGEDNTDCESETNETNSESESVSSSQTDDF